MRVERAVLDLSALAAFLGLIPLDPPEVDTAIGLDATLLDLVELLRTYHDGRAHDVYGDVVSVSLLVDRWEPVTSLLSSIVDMTCRHPDLPIADAAVLALALATKLPIITGLAELVGADPNVAVLVLARRP